MDPGATAGRYACSTVQAAHGRFEIVDVGLNQGFADIGYRADALVDVALAAQSMALVVLGEIAPVAAGNRRIVDLGCRRQSAQARGDVVAETGLALLAVVDAVQADLDLPPNDVGDRR